MYVAKIKSYVKGMFLPPQTLSRKSQHSVCAGKRENFRRERRENEIERKRKRRDVSSV